MSHLEPGMGTSVWVNQGERDATVVAVAGADSLIEYEMPNGTTAMIVTTPGKLDRYGREDRSISLALVCKSRKWAKAIREGGIGLRPNPQGGYIHQVRDLTAKGILRQGEHGEVYPTIA